MILLLSSALAQDATWTDDQWNRWFQDLETQARAVDTQAGKTLNEAGSLASLSESGGATPEQVIHLDKSADALVVATDGLAAELAAGAAVLNGLARGPDILAGNEAALVAVVEATVNGYTDANIAYAAVTAARIDQGGELAAARKQIAHEMAYEDFVVHSDVLFQLGYLVLSEEGDSMAGDAEAWCRSHCDDPDSVLGSSSSSWSSDSGDDDDADIDSVSISGLGYRYVDTAGGVHQLHLDSYGYAGDRAGIEVLLNYHRGFVFKSNGFRLQAGAALRFAGLRVAVGGIFDGYGKPGGADYNLPATGGAYAHLGGRWSLNRVEVFGYGEPRWYRKDRNSLELDWADELYAGGGLGVNLGDGWLRLGAHRMVTHGGTFNAGTAGWVRYF